MSITRTTRRSFPFFKKELRVVVENLVSPKTLKEVAGEISLIFRPEIPEVLNIDRQQIVNNLRGRPEVQNSAEVGREILLRIQGLAPRGQSNDKAVFEATVETKFKEFKKSTIVYTLSTNIPDGFEFSDLSGILASKDVELSKLEVGLDYFESKEFPYLGIKLQGLKERFYVSFINQNASTQSLLNGVVENNNVQFPVGFSEKIQHKIKILAGIAGISELTAEIKQ